jgi:hypothetical protein
MIIMTLERKLRAEMREAEYKAWNSLAGYKFQMFGYWSAIWVHLNKLGEFKDPNPWSDLVKTAKPKAAKAARRAGKETPRHN